MRKAVLVPLMLLLAALPAAARPHWRERCEPSRRVVIYRHGPVCLPEPRVIVREDPYYRYYDEPRVVVRPMVRVRTPRVGLWFNF